MASKLKTATQVENPRSATPLYQPRANYSAQDVAKELGLRLLRLSEFGTVPPDAEIWNGVIYTPAVKVSRG